MMAAFARVFQRLGWEALANKIARIGVTDAVGDGAGSTILIHCCHSLIVSRQSLTLCYDQAIDLVGAVARLLATRAASTPVMIGGSSVASRGNSRRNVRPGPTLMRCSIAMGAARWIGLLEYWFNGSFRVPLPEHGVQRPRLHR
jgi:hypothetical protein